MRALCGAIVTAGALIGLGLTAVGFGQRYGPGLVGHPAGTASPPALQHLSDVDRPLAFVLVLLTSVAVVGLAVTFLGLAYHHHRREREYHLARTPGGLPGGV